MEVEKKDTSGMEVLKKARKKWLVFYTKSRAEKKTQEMLVKFGFEAYLPLQTVVRQWSDRKKKIVVPLFNSYIFVNELESRIMEVLKVPGVVWSVKYNGRPAVLRQKDLDTIKRFVETGLFIETHTIEDMDFGDTVEVVDGPLRGTRGVLTGEYNHEKFTLVMETIGQTLTVNIDKMLLRKIESSEGDNEKVGKGYWN